MPVFRPLLVASPALACALLACSRDGLAPAARGARGDTLYIGVAAGASTDTYFRGVQMAIDRLNAERPRGAPPLGLARPIAQQSTQVAVAAAFRDDPRVVGVVGHTGSAQTLDAAPIYGDVEHGGRNAIVAISPTATNPAVTRASRWVFRVCPTDIDAARALARFALDSLRARRVGIVYRNDLFGRGFTRTIAPALSAGGAEVVENDPYLAGITEYDAYAARMSRRRVDALIVAGGGPDAADLVRALRARGAAPAVLGSDDVSSIDGASRAPGEFDGVRFTAFYDPGSATSQAARDFARDYRSRFAQLPNHQAALSYDAAMLIGRAALATGGDRARMREWIAAVGRDSSAYAGVTGEIRFDDHGDAVGKTVLIGKVGR